MSNLKIGDIVARKSYNHDILFKVTDIVDGQDQDRTIALKGVNMRIVADSPESDIEKMPSKKIEQFNKNFNKKINKIIKNILRERRVYQTKSFTRHSSGHLIDSFHFGKPGRVLHIDGDGEYMDVCLKVYAELEIDAKGKIIPESEQPKVVGSLLREHNPDILILTGHDSFLKEYRNFTDINSYRNTKHFIEAVKEARRYEPGMDELVIFAGACHSLYEAIIEAGANFASSPHRTLIHCLDPVFISEKIAYTSVDRFVSIEEILENTITGVRGVGGLQTRGKYRMGLPKSPYQ
ncbi:MAG: spore coat assemly protein [Candidatus Petromonas sp.]|jgi:spore coat assembly protein|nr:spore coat assemly protein [Candidatus Petromonas sp.]